MEPITVLINSFNHLSHLKQCVDGLRRFRLLKEIVIFDNASTYEPLLDYLRTVDVQVIQSPINQGPRGAFNYMFQQTLNPNIKFFAMTDPDLDFSECPEDLIEHMLDGLDQFPWAPKACPAIRFDDIPASFPWYQRALDIEVPLHTDTISSQWYRSKCDTQFAVYRSPSHFHYDTIRAKTPYRLRHLAYYKTAMTITDEDKFYIGSLPQNIKTGLYWSTLMQDEKEKLGL